MLNDQIVLVKPTSLEQKEVNSFIKEFVYLLKSKFKDGDIFVGGSVAKGTWLRGAYDFDVFVRFDFKKFENKPISDELNKLLVRLKLKFERIHGSRDYFHVFFKGRKVEVVPILKISSSIVAKNITDVSPLHVLWVKSNLNEVLADQVRLLKSFMHAQRVYGAESYIRGFSGYACEILIVYYGSFENVLKNAIKWSKKQVIDVEDYYKRKNVFAEINKAKLESPLILVDPVQKSRNVTAALSEECFDIFIASAKLFIKKPSSSFFVKKEISIREIKKNSLGKVLILKVVPLEGKDDVVAAKMRRVFEYLDINLRKKFIVHSSNWSFEERLFWFDCDKKTLSLYEEIIGPPLSERDGMASFKNVHKSTFKRHDRLYAKEKRKYRLPLDLVKDLKNSDFVRSKIDSWKVI